MAIKIAHPKAPINKKSGVEPTFSGEAEVMFLKAVEAMTKGDQEYWVDGQNYRTQYTWTMYPKRCVSIGNGLSVRFYVRDDMKNSQILFQGNVCSDSETWIREKGLLDKVSLEAVVQLGNGFVTRNLDEPVQIVQGTKGREFHSTLPTWHSLRVIQGCEVIALIYWWRCDAAHINKAMDIIDALVSDGEDWVADMRQVALDRQALDIVDMDLK